MYDYSRRRDFIEYTAARMCPIVHNADHRKGAAQAARLTAEALADELGIVDPPEQPEPAEREPDTDEIAPEEPHDP